MCKHLGTETVATIGVQRQYNYALQPTSPERFVEIVTADQPEAPSYFAHDVRLNRQKHPTLDQTLERTLRPLIVDEVIGLSHDGAQLLDVRDATDFAGAHLEAIINIPLNGIYATWPGTILSPQSPIVIVAEPGQEHESAVRLGRIGLDHLASYLGGGMQAVDGRADLIRQIVRITLPRWPSSWLPSRHRPCSTSGRQRSGRRSGSRGASTFP